MSDVLLTDLLLDNSNDLGETTTGDLTTVSGSANVQQALVRRLLRAPGALLWAPQYGGGLPLQLERINTPTQRVLAAQLGAANLAQDTRVTKASIQIGASGSRSQRVQLQIFAELSTGQSLQVSTQTQEPS